MLAEHSGATVSEAGRLLNAYARHQHARITETAYALVSHALEPTAILSGQPQL